MVALCLWWHHVPALGFHAELVEAPGELQPQELHTQICTHRSAHTDLRHLLFLPFNEAKNLQPLQCLEPDFGALGCSGSREVTRRVTLRAQACTELLFPEGFCIFIFPGVLLQGPSSAWLCIFPRVLFGMGWSRCHSKMRELNLPGSFWLGLELGINNLLS